VVQRELRTSNEDGDLDSPHAKAQAISWFRDSATQHIAQMRGFQAVLERHGLAVEMIKAKRLGYVLYEDEFQVCA